MKKTSIYSKIRKNILGVALVFAILLTVLFLAILAVQWVRMNRDNEVLSENLVDSTTDCVSSYGENVAETLAEAYTRQIDQNFLQARKEVEAVANYMTSLYTSPPRNREEEPAETDSIALISGTGPEEVREELGIIVSGRDYIRSIPDYDTDKLNVLDIYLTTESGMVLDGSGKDYTGQAYTDLREEKWYKGACEKKGAYWAEPFLGKETGLKKITCSVPFYGPGGEIKGVACIDLAVDNIYETALKINSNQVKHVILLDASGRVMVNPDRYELSPEDAGDGTSVRDGEVLVVSQIPENKWKLSVVLDQKELEQMVLQLRQTIADSGSKQNDMTRKLMITLGAIIAVVTALGIGAVMRISKRVANSLVSPIEILNTQVQGLGRGRLEPVSLSSDDEIGELAVSFNRMIEELREYINNYARVSADKERIETELNVATQIQADMLPSIFPAFPERREFDLYASMTPAKEVGGDFYDFFLVDDDHVALIIADVSGKGVPAALFMVIAKTLLKNCTQTGLSPGKILEKVNNQLCENNDAEMFVTTWLGILEISSLKMTCVNAGHEYPAIRRKGGKFELYKDRHGLVLAGMRDVKYGEYQIQLEKGDCLYVYTDGVAEATNGQEELYGTERMLCALNSRKGAGVEELLEMVRADIDQFVQDAPQFDDITMLSLEIKEY